jgi:DNA-binding Lrp family transcriptional regulator
MLALDAIHRRILQALQTDGRISNSDLAERVGLSPSACLRRVQELERAGVIKGYRAILSAEAMDVGLVVYASVALKRHTKEEQEAFQAAMAKAPEVRECHNVTGAIEYLLRVETRDPTAYKHFHTDVQGALPQVATITSYVVLDSPKDDRA